MNGWQIADLLRGKGPGREDVNMTMGSDGQLAGGYRRGGKKMSSNEFPEPPEGFRKYPAGNVIALMTDGDAVSAALEDLTKAGFARDRMYVLAGPAGAERLDVTGQHHGLLGRVYRITGQIGDSHEELIRTADHLRAGGLALRVPATEGDKTVAARILGQHGAVHIVYMGKWASETLAP